MKTCQQFIALLERHPGSRIAINAANGLAIDYSSAVSSIRQVAQWLDEYDGAGIAVALDNGPSAIIADIALMRSNHWCLPIPPFFSQPQTEHALSDSGCQYMLTSGLCDNELASTFDLGFEQLHLYRLPHAKKVAIPLGTKKITYTSGSTGSPKGLCLSENHLFEAVESVALTLPFAPPFRHLSLLPWPVLLENIAGCYACLHMGATCIVPPLSSLADQDSIYDFDYIHDLVTRFRVNSTILVPELLNQYYNYLKEHPSDTSSWQFIAVGGATVPSSLLKRCREMRLPVYEGYGLSEAASVVSLNTPATQRDGTVGKPLQQGLVEIATDGEVMLTRTSYLGTTGSDIKPPTPFPTGDIGAIDENGYLSIVGRKKSIIITGMGRNVAPEWLEAELLGVAGLHQAFVYKNDTNQLAALVVADDTIENLDAVLKNTMLRLPGYAHISRFARVEAFTVSNGLLTGNGKMNRLALRALASSLSNTCIRTHADYSDC